MKTILVVDDERHIVDLVRLYLEKEGFAVAAAGDGDEALALHARHDPDLVILDLMLPGKDGSEVCRELRRRGDTPVLMLTARDDDIDAIVGLELGADDYVTKPFNELTVETAGLDAATPPSGWLTFVADRGAVERIMANLVNNALASTPSGGHVWLSATAVEGGRSASIVLSVTDDGPGFPPGAASRVFERFYRADPARTGPGSGLGLAIVLELATAHGGSAHAENVAPHGARVSVVLPRVPRAG
ncbi:MAG TPA: response regulator [Candidatus Limnocylindrales bacterium]